MSFHVIPPRSYKIDVKNASPDDLLIVELDITGMSQGLSLVLSLENDPSMFGVSMERKEWLVHPSSVPLQWLDEARRALRIWPGIECDREDVFHYVRFVISISKHAAIPTDVEISSLPSVRVLLENNHEPGWASSEIHQFMSNGIMSEPFATTRQDMGLDQEESNSVKER